MACAPIEDSIEDAKQSDQSLIGNVWVDKGPMFLQAEN